MRILIVEDEFLAAQNLASILTVDGNQIDIAQTGEEALNFGKLFSYDLVILDLSLPDIHGLEVLSALRATKIGAPIVVLSGDADVDTRVRCLEGSADDYITKPFNRRELKARIRAIARRSIERAKLVAEAREAIERLQPLTARERDVLGKLVEGQSNKIVAYELGISPRTVEIHRARIMDKMNARSLSDVVRIAFTASLLTKYAA